MNLKITSVVIVLVAVLLLAQSITVVEAKHKAADNGEARAAMKAKSTTFDEKVTGKSATKEQKRAAFSDYKIAFTAWKSAKELWKAAKVTGVDSNISGNKTLVDTAKITKDNAWDTYQEIKKKKQR